ncbi:formate dehydrogenase accessory sulfurtransferase FdhD [Geobacter sp. SVR]|uniref:formate dehydrogenase accessory sulfurtransferase FdhD n=1 Tax=Geobacter sp. SVR TaxID=2495594 RepID=UPI00143EF868|nr:formate dehydrogenase accessory sulfurtransferase FdhD [Geobacter sp. SVR]BCS54575.1 molybdenum cofactor guanylyltransferase [Geobacter sp. SVR]GCF86918.1 molybdenum cofactor guanylyltransferase [Geobacter sp. SVR]
MNTDTFFTYRDGNLEPVKVGVVQEFPLQLIVNGREIATLIASPHDLRFLVAGFLRLQGFVQSLSDFTMFSVCEDFGTANVRITGELPEKLKPVLTSGCGTGVSFSMPAAVAPAAGAQSERFKPGDIFGLMDELSRQADNYRSHGGIHSAAVGRSGELLLYAEDLGRHNTLDRIAGEALFKGIDLSGTALVTSGRVSTEMVAKAALLGVRLIASRTSPTDMAVRLCRESGIALAGYVRGGKFTVYSRPDLIDPYPDSDRIAGVTGVILAGGASRRMGSNKALLQAGDATLIERVYRTLAPLFAEVLIVTNTPESYAFLPCRTMPDIHTDFGAMAGLHAGLAASSTGRIFVAACDMPSLNPDLIRLLCAADPGAEAVVPVNEEGLREPLHAVYSRSALATLEETIAQGERSILTLLDRLESRLVTPEEYAGIAEAERSFSNVNTPEEYERLTRS